MLPTKITPGQLSMLLRGLELAQGRFSDHLKQAENSQNRDESLLKYYRERLADCAASREILKTLEESTEIQLKLDH